MCVYCKGVPACDHERDVCAASRGERCITCRHDSAAFLPYTPGLKRVSFWFSPGQWSTRKPLKTASQTRRVTAKKRAT